MSIVRLRVQTCLSQTCYENHPITGLGARSGIMT